MALVDVVINRRALSDLIRFRWWVVAAWMLAQYLLVDGDWSDWGYFKLAALRLVGQQGTAAEQGIHLYTTSIQFQFGLPPLLLAELARMAGVHDRAVFEFVAMVLGLIALVVLERLVLRVRPASAQQIRALSLMSGVLLAQSWGVLAIQSAHIDDAIVLCAAVGIWAAIAWRRPWIAAVLAGTSAAGKPWGVILVPFLLALPAKQRLRAISLACTVLLMWWLPFLLDPHTLPALSSMQLHVQDLSPLHLIAPWADLKPWWVRPAQFIVGSALVGVMVLRGQWPAALFAGIAWRMMLDPGLYAYYWTDLLFAAIIWVSVRPSRRSFAMLILTWVLSREMLRVLWDFSHPAISLTFLGLGIGLALSTARHRAGPEPIAAQQYAEEESVVAAA